MKTIRISDEVWGEIAKRGKFRETEEDVLRREFGLKPVGEIEPRDIRKLKISRGRGYATRQFIRGPRKATRVLSPRVIGNRLEVRFPEDGTFRAWDLPPKNDKDGIRQVLKEALDFGEKNDATDGQLKAIRKALTDKGYHLIGPRRLEGLI
jgi:hypothetical protein